MRDCVDCAERRCSGGVGRRMCAVLSVVEGVAYIPRFGWSARNALVELQS